MLPEVTTFENTEQNVLKTQEKIYSCPQCPFVTNKVHGIAVHISAKIHNPSRKPRGKPSKKLKKTGTSLKAPKNAIVLEAEDEATVEVKEIPKRLRNLRRRPVCCTEPGCEYITNKKSNLKIHLLKSHL